MRLHQRMRREQGRHTDDWLITYADTITLLLCLFVVILSIKTAENNHRDTAAPAFAASPVAEHAASLRPPSYFAGSWGDDMPRHAAEVAAPVIAPAVASIGADEIVAEASAPVIVAATEADRPPRADAMTAGAMTAGAMSAGTMIGDTMTAGAMTGDAMTGAPVPAMTVARPVPLAPPDTPRTAPIPGHAAVPDRTQFVGGVDVEQQGDRVTTLRVSSATFFGSGFAALSGAGKSILRDVAVALKSSEFAAYHISIEGHTDDTPINTAQFQSNWELSTARAAAVVRFFLEQGIPARKLTAAGYADAFPIAPNRNEDGTVIPENQARNRRVVIKLERIDKADQ